MLCGKRNREAGLSECVGEGGGVCVCACVHVYVLVTLSVVVVEESRKSR